jgi:hypothetical protein
MYPNQYCNPCTPECPEVLIPAPPDCEGEPCEEIVQGECVRYTGPAIPCLSITQGESLNSVIQKIAAQLCECCENGGGTVCAVPVISATTLCSQDGSSFNVTVSTNHVANNVQVAIEYRDSNPSSTWTVLNITTTGNALTDIATFTIPLNGSQTSTYQVRAKRQCGVAFSAYTTTSTVTTPTCPVNPPPTCNTASNLQAVAS